MATLSQGVDHHSDEPDSEQSAGTLDYLASFRLIQPHLTGQRLKLAAAMLLATVSVVLELVPVYVIYRLISDVSQNQLTSASLLISVIVVFAAVIAGYLLLGVAMGISHLVAFEAIYQLRLRIARHMAALPLGYFADRRSGEAKKLVVDDPEKLELIVAHGLPEGVSAVATWLAVSVWLFIVDWRMACAAVFITPVSFVFLTIAMKQGSRFAKEYQLASERMNAAVVEYLNGMPVVKIFNRSGESFREASDAVKDYADLETKWGKAYLPFGSSFLSLVLSNIIFILPVGAFLIAKQDLDLVTLLFFVILGANYSRPLLKVFHLFHELAHISMGSMLVSNLLNTPAQQDSGRVVPLSGHDVTFDDVCFGYEQTDVLHHVSFTAREGSVTALVGPSGSGKSTIASLIPRFFDVGSGRILIGGVDVRKMGMSQLMDTVAFVFQDTILFSDTIAANIRFGRPDATDEAVENAARAAQAHEFILALPEGYQTRIGDLGRQLSGGERQRLAIARAILKDAPVIVLDEATAFADPDNESAIQAAIEALAKGRTLIVVAHRLHTIQDAENIVVVEQGRIAEQGAHMQLLENQGLYTTLWEDFIAARRSGLRQVVSEHAQGDE